MRNGGSCALAHLVRDFTAHSEGLGAQKDFGAAGLEIAARLLAAWDECRWDADRARLSERLGPLKEELRALLEQAARKSAKTKRHRSFAKNLLKRWPALWTFTAVPGVAPTNNHAERGLRGAVIYRKLSLGSQSEGASAPSNDCSRPRSPAACRGARSLPTSATSLPPGSAATPSPCSSDSAGDLNAYLTGSVDMIEGPPRSSTGQPAAAGLATQGLLEGSTAVRDRADAGAPRHRNRSAGARSDRAA